MLSLAIAHRLVLVAERLDGQHRPERLLLDDRHRAVAAVEHGGQVVEAVGQRGVVGPGRRRSAAWRPRRSRAATYASTFSRCAAEISGPVSALSSNGPPSRICSARRTSSSTNSSWIDSSTTSRAPAEHTWPECRKTAVSAKSSAASQVGVGEHDVGVLAAQLEGDLLHRLRGRGHDPLPVARPPVNDTRSTRGSSPSGAPARGAGAEHQVGDARPGRPASSSSRISRIAVCGVSSLGLSTKVLPAARRGRDLPGGLQQRVVPRRDQRRRRRPARARCG